MKLEGKVWGLCTAPPTTEGLVKKPCGVVEVTHEGFKDDKHAGFLRAADNRNPQYVRGTLIRSDRQFSAVSIEDCEIIARILKIRWIRPAWLGANIAFLGLPNFSSLPRGSKLLFPDRTVLVVEGENLPCRGPGEVIAEQYPTAGLKASDFPKAALHHRGVVGVVERPGTIAKGEKVEVLVYEPQKYIVV